MDRLAESGLAGGFEEDRARELQAFDATEGGVLVLDVDHHVRVDAVEGEEELRPVVRVVALADGDEVPGGGLRPLVGPLVSAEVDPIL